MSGKMIVFDEDLRKLFEDFHQCCEEALVSNFDLIDDISAKVHEQNQKIIEQNNLILSQCRSMKLQSSGVVERLKKLKQLIVQWREPSRIEQTIEDTPRPTELRADDVELNEFIPGQEDAILDPSTIETVHHLKDVPDGNSEAPPNNNCQVNGETNNKQEEKVYPDWLAKNEFICNLMENQRKMEMLIEPLSGRGGSNEMNILIPKFMAYLKEICSYMECFCVDPEEIEKNEDLKENFAKLQLFMTETGCAEIMQKMNATCSNIASLADDSMPEKDEKSERHDRTTLVEKVAVSGPSEKHDDLNYNTNNSSSRKLTLKRKKDEVKVVEKKDDEEAQVVEEGDDDKKVRKMRSRPFTRGLSKSRSFTISSQKRLRSGRELVNSTNNISERRIRGRSRVVKSLDGSIKSIEKAETTGREIFPVSASLNLRETSSRKCGRRSDPI